MIGKKSQRLYIYGFEVEQHDWTIPNTVPCQGELFIRISVILISLAAGSSTREQHLSCDDQGFSADVTCNINTNREPRGHHIVLRHNILRQGKSRR